MRVRLNIGKAAFFMRGFCRISKRSHQDLALLQWAMVILHACMVGTTSAQDRPAAPLSPRIYIYPVSPSFRNYTSIVNMYRCGAVPGPPLLLGTQEAGQGSVLAA